MNVVYQFFAKASSAQSYEVQPAITCWILADNNIRRDVLAESAPSLNHHITTYVAELVAKVTGFTGRIEHDLTKPNGSHRKVLDIKKIEAIGWKPEISLEEGLTELYKTMY